MVYYLEMRVKRIQLQKSFGHKERKHVWDIGPLCPVYG